MKKYTERMEAADRSDYENMESQSLLHSYHMHGLRDPHNSAQTGTVVLILQIGNCG